MQAGISDFVLPALIGDELVEPESAHDLNLFLGTFATIFEVYAKRLIFHVIPANIDCGGLLGVQSSLPLQ